MSDATIIADILGGKTGLFSRLVERYLPLVRGICASHVVDPAAQDDLVQETFLAGYLGLNRLRQPERFAPWLARIARRKCISWIRSQARQQRARERMAHETGGTTAPDPVQEATRREMQAWARREIARLPENTREAMVLCYLEGYTIAEVSRLLGAREASIKKRLQYGRQLVGEKMLGEFGDRPREKKTENLRRRVLLALPLTAAPWKSASAQGASVAAGIGGSMAIAKIVAVLALPVLAAGIAIHYGITPPEQELPANPSAARDGLVANATPGAPTESGTDAEDAAQSAPEVADSGELALRLRYRMRPEGVTSPSPNPGSGEPGPPGLPPDEWPPVPDARVEVKPLRPNRQVQKMLFEDIDLDPRIAELLMARASLRGAEDGRRQIEEQGITEDIVAREEAKLLKLREKYGERGLESLFEQLVAPGPPREWISGTSSADGTLVFPGLAPGAYRVEVILPADERPRRARLAPSLETGATATGTASAVSAGASTAATATIRIRKGKRTAHTLAVTDTVSEIKGAVVDGETGEPVGLLALLASGEALCGMRHRIWVNTDGTFTIPLNVTAFGEFTIEGKPQGFIPVTVHDVRRIGEPAQITIALARRPTISGHVWRPDGSPVTGISILRRDVEGAGSRGVARTDDDGFYSAAHDGGVITLCASGTLCQSEDQTFNLEADESVVHDFAMPATAAAIIHVHTESGEVPEEIDMATLRRESASLAGTILRRRGDHYVIPTLKPARYDLVFAVRGFETVSRSFTIGDDLTDAVLSVQLVSGQNDLAVQVLDALGDPKPDADIQLMLVVRRVDENGRSTGKSSATIAQERTDEEGLAVFEDLAAGDYGLQCGGASREVTLPHADTVVLALPPSTVKPDALYLDLDRAKAYDALRNRLPLELDHDAIRVLAPSGTLSNRRLESGENIVFAFKRGYPPATAVIPLSEEEVEAKKAIRSNVCDRAFELVFGEAGAVHGVIETEKGQPVAEEELCVLPAELWTLIPSGPERYRWHSLGRAFAGGARSAEDGSFQIRFLSPGSYVLSIRDDRVSERFEIIAGRETGPIILRR